MYTFITCNILNCAKQEPLVTIENIQHTGDVSNYISLHYDKDIFLLYIIIVH